MRCALIVLATWMVTGCGPSPAQQAADGRDRAGSWAASIQVAVDDWADDLVPARYVHITLDAAAKDLASEAAQLRQVAGPSAGDPLDAVTRAVPGLEDAVLRGDRPRARQTAAALSHAVPPPPIPPSARPDSR